MHKKAGRGRKEKYDTPEEGKGKKYKNELQGGGCRKGRIRWMRGVVVESGKELQIAQKNVAGRFSPPCKTSV